MEQRPSVGIGVIVTKNRLVLMGKRKNAHGEGSWHFPGGHLEFGESWEECAKREVEEETGVKITNLRFGTVTNDIFKEEQKHYITIFVIADYVSGIVETKKPNKCDGWKWISWDDLPTPLFLPIQNLLKTSFNPFQE